MLKLPDAEFEQAYRRAQFVGLVAIDSEDYFSRALECFARGEVIVALRGSDDSERRELARVGRVIVPSPDPRWWHGTTQKFPSGALAQLSFTSGTEGQPKGVLLTHGNLADPVDRLNAVMQVDSGIREYIGVPIHHSFGFGRCRAVAAAGGCFFVPANGFNPREIGEMLRSGQINALSAVPTLCRVLLRNQDCIGRAGRRLKWLEIGSQYMSRQEKEQIKTLFPNARILQHYGLTEASRTTLLEVHAVEGEALESVGRTFGDVEVRIDGDSRIQIRGPHTARGILVGGALASALDEEGWLTSSDRGEIRDDMLYYHGRVDDVINTGGVKIAPDVLESSMLDRLGWQSGIVVTRIPDAMRGDGILITHSPDDGTSASGIRLVAGDVLRRLGVSAGDAVRVWELGDVPRTETGKVKRRVIADRYLAAVAAGESLGGDSSTPNPPLVPASYAVGEAFSPLARITAVFSENFPGRPVGAESTFLSLEGDSLTYVGVQLALEKAVGDLPPRWERLSIRELADASQKRRGRAQTAPVYVESAVLIRAIAPLFVVMNHAGLRFLAGGAALLLLVVGYNFARFQLGSLLEGRFAAVLNNFVLNVLVPYWLILGGYEFAKESFSAAEIFLYNNFAGEPSHPPFATWFIQAVAQSVLLTCVLLVPPASRRWAKENPGHFALIFLAIACLLRIYDQGFMPVDMKHQGAELFWVMWLFGLGMALQLSGQSMPRWVLTTLAVLAPLVFYMSDWSRITILIAGGCMLLWVPRCRVPAWAVGPIGVLGSSSIFIYMLHERAPTNSFSSDWPVDIVRIALGVGLGIVGWWAYSRAVASPLQDRVRKLGQSLVRLKKAPRP